MSIKKLLGLEAFPLSDSEIINKIKEAQEKHLQKIVFDHKGQRVTLSLQEVHPEGIMKGSMEYNERYK